MVLEDKVQGTQGNVARNLLSARDKTVVSNYDSLLSAIAARRHKQFTPVSVPFSRQDLSGEHSNCFLGGPSYKVLVFLAELY